MSLHLHKRGKVWHIRGTVAGKAVQETTGTTDKKRAEAFKVRRENELWDRHVFGERAAVSFEECALAYRDHRNPEPRDFALIERLIDHFSITVVSTIDQSACDRAVSMIVGPNAAPATKTRSVITPLTYVLNFGAKRGWCDVPKFDRPRADKGRTEFLTPTEAQALIEAAAPHLKPLLIFLFGTGARLYEALSLEWKHVRLHEGLVILTDTKNGKTRIAKLSQASVAALSALRHRDGHVFRKEDGEAYADTGKQHGGQIKTAFRGACRRAGLVTVEKEEPWTDSRGIARVRKEYGYPYSPHTCRHTWATWFYAVTRDPMLLRSEGDWSSIALVERYAHLMTPGEARDVHLVWGAKHHAIGDLIGAQNVQRGM